MARLRIKRMSDGAIFTVQMGSVKGIVYKTNGDIDYTQSFPYIEYYGETFKKIINTSLDSDIFTLLTISGTGIRNFTITKNKHYQLVQGQYDGENLKNVVKNENAYSYTVSGYLAPSFYYTKCDGFGFMDGDNARISYNYDSMFLYDSDNDKIFRTEQNEVIYTGGIRYSEKTYLPVNLPMVWGKGYRRFSDLKYQVTTADVKYGNLSQDMYGYLMKIDSSELYNKWLNNEYYNDNVMSTIGKTARKPLAVRNHITGTTSFINLFPIGTKLTEWTNDPTPDNPDINPNDPNDPDNPNDPDYPAGDGDDSTDPIPIPDEPPVLEIMQSIIKVYEITPNELIKLSSDLWSTNFLDQILNVMANPIDSIISLSALFCPTLDTNPETEIYIGNVPSTAKAMPLGSSYALFKSQPIYVPMYYGNFHDYKNVIQLYLPFYGVMVLPNYTMGHTITIAYQIDIISQSATIIIASNIQGVEVVIDRKSANLGYRIPISGRDSSAYVMGIWTNPIEFMTDNKQKQSSTLNGNAKYLDVPYPYLLITRTNLAQQIGFSAIAGAPNETVDLLSNLSGETTVKDIELSIPHATVTEIEEIKQLLRNGVIL